MAFDTMKMLTIFLVSISTLCFAERSRWNPYYLSEHSPLLDAVTSAPANQISAVNFLNVTGTAGFFYDSIDWEHSSGIAVATFTNSHTISTKINFTTVGDYTVIFRAWSGHKYGEAIRTYRYDPAIAPNTPPTVTTPGDVTLAEDTASGAIAFTIGDDVTAPASLTVLATSSNTNVLTQTGISLGGSGSARTITLTPNSNSNGVSTVTISVTDASGATTQTSFMATWTAANDAPTITNPGPQTINEDGNTGALSFTVGDVETLAASLTVTGNSSDTTLLPGSGVVISGATSSRSVTLTPAANLFGTSTVTLTVSDGTTSSQVSFSLTVNSVNDTPVIENVANQAGSVGSAVQIPFYANDVEEGGNGLIYTKASSNATAVPVANISFGGSNTNRTATITGAAAGTSTITITATDAGALFASDAFDFVVSVPANTPPTITDIANQNVAEDTSTGALAFTIGDAETSPASMGLTTSSSNPTLIPTANILFGGSGASRTVAATPAANQFGSSTLTVTVSDGALTASDAFTVTVASVNDAPTISNIADQTTDEDVILTVNPIVGDVETAVTDLTLVGTSNNQTLVPDVSIVESGTGATRTAVITPAANQFGTATITLTVGDGTTTSQDTFVLTVNSVNDNPTITDLTDKTTPLNTASGPHSFTVGDVETAAGSLAMQGTSSNPTLVPNGNISFGGSGASRTVTVTPATGQSGQTTITAIVSDANGGSVADSFVLTVTPSGVFEYYVSTTGAFANAGTLASPWNLDRARQLVSGKPESGSTVFIRSGRYSGEWTFSAPGVKYQGYSEEWPSIGHDSPLVGHIMVHPAADDIVFQQIAFNCGGRTANAEGIYTSGDARRTKFIHCLIFNMPQCLALQDNRTDGGGFEIYGCILLFGGWNNSATDAGGHNCYFQHRNSTDNLQFENTIDAYSFSKLLNCGGSAAAYNQNMLVKDSIFIYDGGASQAASDLGRPTEYIAMVGNQPISQMIFQDNSHYGPVGVGVGASTSIQFGYATPLNTDVTFRGNYWIGGTTVILERFQNIIWTNNVHDLTYTPVISMKEADAVSRDINRNEWHANPGELNFKRDATTTAFSGWQAAGYDLQGSADTVHKAITYIRYYLNTRYNHRHKAHVFIHNPLSKAKLNIIGTSAGLAVNDQFVVLNALAPDVTLPHAFVVVASGTYVGGNIQINMSTLTVAQPSGVSYPIPNCAPKAAGLIVKKIN